MRLSTYVPTLIREAIRDFQAILATPGYRVNMGVWHQPVLGADGNEYCETGLAGCVMAQSLGG